MTHPLHEDLAALSRSVYYPHTNLDDLLGSYLKAVVHHLHSGEGRIMLKGPRNGGDRTIDYSEGIKLGSPRLISTTTANLHNLVRDQQFSRSLMAELDFLRLKLPPLTQRREDIPDLVTYFLKKYAASEKEITAEALNLLKPAP